MILIFMPRTSLTAHFYLVITQIFFKMKKTCWHQILMYRFSYLLAIDIKKNNNPPFAVLNRIKLYFIS
jgi:hypothetical protein